MARLDLDSLRPPDHTVVYGGVELRIPGRLAIPTVFEILQLDEELGAADEAGDPAEQKRIQERQHELCLELLAERNPPERVAGLRFAYHEVDRIFAFALSGFGATEEAPAEKAVDAVLGALVDRSEGGGDPPTVAASAATRPKGSRSPKRSRVASSA